MPQNHPSRGHSFLSLAGAYPPAGAPGLQEWLSAAMEGEPHDLVIDMREVRSLSQEAMTVLYATRTRQRSLNRELTLIFPSGSVTDLALTAAGLGGHFTTIKSVPVHRGRDGSARGAWPDGVSGGRPPA